MSDFRKFHGCRVAVVLNADDRAAVITGQACFQVDKNLGAALCINAACDEEPLKLVLVEDNWNGDIARDTNYGCHFCFVPSDADPVSL